VAHPKIEDFILFFSMWIIGSSMKNDGREGDVKPEESMRTGQAHYFTQVVDSIRLGFD
jgi:hypothetical protein